MKKAKKQDLRWIIIISFFALSIYNIWFGLFGMVCMGAPIYHALRGREKTPLQKALPPGLLYVQCGKEDLSGKQNAPVYGNKDVQAHSAWNDGCDADPGDDPHRRRSQKDSLYPLPLYGCLIPLRNHTGSGIQEQKLVCRLPHGSCISPDYRSCKSAEIRLDPSSGLIGFSLRM